MSAPEPKRCLGCGYILEHLPEPRCPECGRPFDPGDPTTFARGAPRGWLSSAAHALLAALLIVVSGVAGLCVGAYLWHKQGHYYVSGADQALAATCIAVAGFVVCGSRRWRGRELLAAFLIVGVLAFGVSWRWTNPWGKVQAAGWVDYFRRGWWISDVNWLIWVVKFTALPFLLPLICRAIGWLPLTRCAFGTPYSYLLASLAGYVAVALVFARAVRVLALPEVTVPFLFVGAIVLEIAVLTNSLLLLRLPKAALCGRWVLWTAVLLAAGFLAGCATLFLSVRIVE